MFKNTDQKLLNKLQDKTKKSKTKLQLKQDSQDIKCEKKGEKDENIIL